jgi:hypothetical protein
MAVDISGNDNQVLYISDALDGRQSEEMLEMKRRACVVDMRQKWEM